MTYFKDGVDYGRSKTALALFVARALEDVHTCLPGLIDEYDASTRRATVQPATRIVMADDKALDRPPVVNAPVVWPSGGGWSISCPLAQGDACLLVFSMRGLSAFLETFELSDPTPGHRFELSDAFVVPGLGPAPPGTVDPVLPDALIAQSDDGSTALTISADGVRVKVDGGGLQKLATETFVRQQFNTHTHSTPGGPSGPPIQPAPLEAGRDIT